MSCASSPTQTLVDASFESLLSKLTRTGSRPTTASTQFRPSRIDQPKMTAFAELEAHNPRPELRDLDDLGESRGVEAAKGESRV